MEFVFGPVNSRRLGKSLGVDTIPKKTCNWNCVYCQLGRTSPMTNERREFYPRRSILDELQHSLATLDPKSIDWITFVGSGEPTLYLGLGWLIHKVKSISDVPVAVITNGSLLHVPEVREELLAADAVLPSLDAGTASIYRKINRPFPKLIYSTLVEGLSAFRQEYSKKLWVEVMLIRGVNDSVEELRRISAIVAEIQPDEVHINVPSRPPVETWVKPPTNDRLRLARCIIDDKPRLVQASRKTIDSLDELNPVEKILSILSRHPISESDLYATLTGWSEDRIEAVLEELTICGKAQKIERLGQKFWTDSNARFP